MKTVQRAAIYLRSFLTSEKGASMVEYALLLSFIVVVAISAIAYVGREAASNIDVGSRFP